MFDRKDWNKKHYKNNASERKAYFKKYWKKNNDRMKVQKLGFQINPSWMKDKTPRDVEIFKIEQRTSEILKFVNI